MVAQVVGECLAQEEWHEPEIPAAITVAKGIMVGNRALESNLYGCSVVFALTAMQQFLSFFCFLILHSMLYVTPHKITPKRISSMKEVVSIIFGGRACHERSVELFQLWVCQPCGELDHPLLLALANIHYVSDAPLALPLDCGLAQRNH